MMNFWKCFAYLALIGILAHFFGLVLSHRHYRTDRLPWRSLPFEQNGRFWDRTLKVRRWMNRVPDMSRLMPDMVPKRIASGARAADVERLIRETCVAELTHDLLSIAGFGCVLIWDGMGGWILSLMFCVGNIPFAIIQRYNRPRLCRLHKWLLEREGNEPIDQNELVEAKKV